MTERVQRIVPRRLSFNLEDFPEIEDEGEDHGGNPRGGPTSSGLDNVTPITLGGTGGGLREELNLIGALETPATLASEGSGAPHVVVPAAMLQNLMASQESLAHLAERGSPVMLFELEPPLTDEVLATPYPSGDNKSLRLKEFSKFLAGRAFTWYAKLRPGSIRSWEELATEFCGKFLEEEGVLHIMDLGRVKQKSGESLISFIKRYRDRALQCKETLPEADLVYGCIKNIEDGSQIFLSLGGITTFAELMRRGVDVAEAIEKQGKRPKEADSAFEVCALEDRGRKRGFRSPHPSKGQLKAGKILLPEEGRNKGDLHRQPLPDHGVHVITAANREIRIEEVKEDEDNEEALLSTGLAKSRGFRVLFSQLGLGQEAQMKAVGALTRIIKEKGGELGTANAPLTRLARSHATAILFKEPSFPGTEFCHNKPLYVEACVEGVRIRRALVDNGSGVNIMPAQLFRLLNIPKHRVRVSNITLNTFQGEPVESQGRVNAVLEVGPIKTVIVFQVVEGDPGYTYINVCPQHCISVSREILEERR
ncbi:Retrotransposon gag domain [Sesbania bispinosa]|nr:Retrotransposon gag domain [Sesbania bispinosa]